MILYHLPDGDLVHQYKKSIVILFSGMRHVISTGPNNGGYREDLMAVFNHDANPGPGMACVMRDRTYEGHMNIIALEDLGLDPERCSGLCTAASMDNASICSMTCQELTVTAIATGGIEHNGGRAGDPASFYEKNGAFESICEKNRDPDHLSKAAGPEDVPGPVPGTINILLHINASLDRGCLARTLVTATEAKTAVLQELRAGSHYSCGIATGSGTDGIISICNPSSPLKLTNAGKNSKLGELIGKTVKQAVREALFKQSGLCPDQQRDVLRILGRFGIDEDRLWATYSSRKISSDQTLSKAAFIDRLDHLRREPGLVQSSFLFAHILDLLAWGMISEKEAGQMAACLPPGRLQAERDCPGPERLVSQFIDFLVSPCSIRRIP